MSGHKTFFGKIIAWLTGEAKELKDVEIKTAIAVTEGIKTFFESKGATALATVVDDVTGTQLADDVKTIVQNNITKVIAVEMGIQDLPDNPTQQDIQTFEDEALTAFGGKNLIEKSKLYTEIAFQTANILKPFADGTEKVTFANVVKALDDAYELYKKDVAEQTSEETQTE